MNLSNIVEAMQKLYILEILNISDDAGPNGFNRQLIYLGKLYAVDKGNILQICEHTHVRQQ